MTEMKDTDYAERLELVRRQMRSSWRASGGLMFLALLTISLAISMLMHGRPTPALSVLIPIVLIYSLAELSYAQMMGSRHLRLVEEELKAACGIASEDDAAGEK